MTAGELLAKLENDPDYQRRMAEKERVRQERKARRDESLSPYLDKLHQLGMQSRTLEELVREYAPLPDDAIEVLLSALSALSDPRAQETVVRALGAAENPFDGRPLAECFDSTRDEGLKWAIANTIALTRPRFIDVWLAALRRSDYWDQTIAALENDSAS